MKEKYKILNNAIIDSQAYICAFWLEVEGILFILYDNEFLKLLKKDDKYYFFHSIFTCPLSIILPDKFFKGVFTLIKSPI